jgi:nucleoside-diphosphate-sugar epimerase
VHGSRRVFDAVARAGVPVLVHASSVGTYSPGPKDRPVDESWPTRGIPSSFYSRHKAEVERMLDDFQRERPGVRVVRLRPGLIFKRSAATEIRRLFVGPLLPPWAVRRSLIPVVPDVPGLSFQAVHSDDVGHAYRLAVLDDAAHGAFNVAAEPVIDGPALASMLGRPAVRLPAAVLRGVAAAAYAVRVTPTEPGWLDMALGVPTMSTARARDALGWSARVSAPEALRELVGGLRDGAVGDTATLGRAASGGLRMRELRTGLGARQ